MSEDEPLSETELSETERALKKQGIEYHREPDGTLVVPGNAFSNIFGDDEDDEDAPASKVDLAPVSTTRHGMPYAAEPQPVSMAPAVPSKRTAITSSFNNAELIRTMAEGDRTAAAIITGVLNDPFLGGALTVLRIDEMNIRGRQLTAAFEYCGNSLPSLLCCVATCDQGMIDHLNKTFSDEKAVTAGGSRNRINLKFGI